MGLGHAVAEEDAERPAGMCPELTDKHGQFWDS